MNLYNRLWKIMGGSLWNIWIAIVRVLEQLYDQNMGSEKSCDWNIFGGDWGLGNFL